MRTYVVATAAVALAVFLGYRQWSLERQVDALSRQLGAVSAPVESDTVHADAPDEAVNAPATASAATHAQRLARVEAALSSIKADIRSLEKATGDMPDKTFTDQQILSVMKEQGAKVMESQLKFHRERWLEQREGAVAEFSKRFNLSQDQSDQLWGLLSSETDKIIEILRKPESYENPEEAAKEWRQILMETDMGAHRVLEPQKAVVWDQTRWLERKALWPWLPD